MNDESLERLLDDYKIAITDSSGDAFYQEERILNARKAFKMRDQQIALAARKEEVSQIPDGWETCFDNSSRTYYKKIDPEYKEKRLFDLKSKQEQESKEL